MPTKSVVIHGRLMQLTTRLPKRRTSRPTRRRKVAARQLTPEAAETRDARRGGGPEDRALYSCMCGFAFKAKVTTSVDCPHCGTEQAW
jgi:rubrerythrin